MSLNNTIEKRVWIKASAETVYKALTNAKDLEKWFCDRANCTPSEGGELTAYWKSRGKGQKGRAVFTQIVPCISLKMRWKEDGRDATSDSPEHVLQYTIKSKSGMTEVVMVDSGDAELDDETYSFLDNGWNSVLLELKDFCERKERLLKMRRNQETAPFVPDEHSLTD